MPQTVTTATTAPPQQLPPYVNFFALVQDVGLILALLATVGPVAWKQFQKWLKFEQKITESRVEADRAEQDADNEFQGQLLRLQGKLIDVVTGQQKELADSVCQMQEGQVRVAEAIKKMAAQIEVMNLRLDRIEQNTAGNPPPNR